ncbi:MAG: hypothetical protein JW797_02285 [Bradymonadales bacterium]|nr:hypothetical protein [Bradymonadales bacterium]
MVAHDPTDSQRAVSLPFHMMRAAQAGCGALWDTLSWMWQEAAGFEKACLRGGVDDLVTGKLAQLETWLKLRLGELDPQVADQFGFQLDDGQFCLLGETDRLELWLVRPFLDLRDQVPLVLIPPMILDPGVVAWEPGRSFVHYLADRQLPTAVLLNKDIRTHRAVARMTLEEYILDVRALCRIASQEFSGLQVILGGYCQGGEVAMRCLASGRLQGLARYGFFGVAPIHPAGMGDLYENYRHLLPGTTLDQTCVSLETGERAVSGDVMRAVINYGNPAVTNPVSELLREWSMCAPPGPRPSELKMWRWLNRTIPIPYHIVEHTDAGYASPMKDGVYQRPVFGELLDLKRLGEYGVRAIFVGTARRDTLVRPGSSSFLKELLAGIVDVHLCEYDKGHLGMLRDCILPGSDEPLDGTNLLGQEGPVLWYRRVVRPEPAC